MATYIFTAVFVYMSEKDLEHHIATTQRIIRDENKSLSTDGSPPTLPSIARHSGSSNDTVSFEQFRKNGFVEIDLERQAGPEIVRIAGTFEHKDRKKPRLILFN